MLTRTLKDRLEISLPKYIWRWEERILLGPSEGLWYTINWSLVWPDTIRWVKHWTTARFLEIESQGKKIKVVEHLISALRAAWITHASILVKPWLMPVIWPWIEPVYWLLKEASVLVSDSLPTIEIQEKKEYSYGDATMVVEPSDNLDIDIQTNHPDLVDLYSEALSVIDVTSSLVEHVTARPIARLQDPKIKAVHSLLTRNPFYPLNGISDTWYINTNPWDSWDEIVSRMQEKYQKWRNEHLYHTLVADFLW